MAHPGIARLKSLAGVCTIVLALSACGSSQVPGRSPDTDVKPADPHAGPAERPVHPGGVPETAQKLRQRLLTASDVGPAYKALPESDHKDNSTFGPCEPDFARYGVKDPKELDMAAEVNAGFALEVGDGRPVLTEQLSSDTSKKLAAGLKVVFDVLSTCGPLEVPESPGQHGKISITMEKAPLPAQKLGEEQYRVVSTATGDGKTEVTEVAGVRVGNVGLILTGPPDMVEESLAKAVAKVKGSK
ncbi:hypothetical protein [Streptomyces telluris]|uniref:Uncharacterized protein n=1 Tax=Streptomyces telluris TaxID=2720021 RepID=A0A9X2LKX5_9ACTN|nr:hypothetical protein [Streptomyces telluris]MCQ8773095.1 hypothetical protein [Streptomyces telluris]